MSSKTYITLYSRDSDKRIRIWYMEQEGVKHRTVTGLQDGKHMVSEWTSCLPKNVGRSNETSAVKQASSEVIAHYKKKTKSGWRKDIPSEDFSAFVAPMLAHKFDIRRITSWPIYSQPKLDGIRCIAKKDGLFSRNGERISSCPHILEQLEFSKDIDVIYDGELYNHDLKNDFNSITSIVKRQKLKPEDIEKARSIIQYHIYDAVIPAFTFSMRLQFLRNLQQYQGESIVLVKTDALVTESEIGPGLNKYLQEGYEGQIIRHGNTGYEKDKRSYSLMKNKNFQDSEFEIVSISEGKGNWSGKAKSIELTDGKITFSAGIRGNEAYLAEVLSESNKYIGTKAKVRFQNLTPDGIPRFGVVVELNRRW